MSGNAFATVHLLNIFKSLFNKTALFLSSALLFFGCVAKTPEVVPAPTAIPAPQWQCDPKADKAMEEGDLETGLREHARFVADHPDNPLAHYHLGYAFGQMGDIHREIAHYEKAISLGYTHNEQLFFNLAMAYAELSQFSKAIDTFGQVLRLDPDSTDTLTELSRIYQELGDVQNERRTLEQLLKLTPKGEAESIKERIHEISDD